MRDYDLSESDEAIEDERAISYLPNESTEEHLEATKSLKPTNTP